MTVDGSAATPSSAATAGTEPAWFKTVSLTSRCVQAMTCRAADPKDWLLPEEVARTVWNRINPPPGVESLPHGPNIALGQPAVQSSTATNTLTFQAHMKHLALSAAERATDGYCEDSPFSIAETKREVQVHNNFCFELIDGWSGDE